MKRVWIVLAVVLSMVIVPAVMAENAPQKVYDLADQLAEIGKDPVIVKAVKAENARGKSLASIREMDEKWKATAGVADFMKVLMNNESGRYLKKLQNSAAFYAEIFVMDNQGALVGLTDKTSDYWQGDEAKFKNSYSGGKGSMFVDEVEFDDSTQVYISQVSVPVLDGGKAIGAITFGIDVEKID